MFGARAFQASPTSFPHLCPPSPSPIFKASYPTALDMVSLHSLTFKRGSGILSLNFLNFYILFTFESWRISGGPTIKKYSN